MGSNENNRPLESVEDLIAALVLAREKAETLDETQISDQLSRHVTRLRREVKKATKNGGAA